MEEGHEVERQYIKKKERPFPSLGRQEDSLISPSTNCTGKPDGQRRSLSSSKYTLLPVFRMYTEYCQGWKLSSFDVVDEYDRCT